MTSVVEARAAMLAAVQALPAETVALEHALGRTLAQPVHALRAQPPFAASAMDGYALRSAETPGRLRIAGESAAGRGFGCALRAGEAVRISTGAPMPAGADAVLIQEDARIEDNTLHAGAVRAGRHVRAQGIDFAAHACLLGEGRNLDPIALALAAAAGAVTLQVVRRPRVTILCAGDEIAPPGAIPHADQIFESCSYAVAALATHWGALAERVGPLPDDHGEIERAASDALARSDLVVFIGGASVGPHDHARPALERLGARLLVRKVDMRPGKPTWFASTPLAPVLGLPGNPASAIVASVLFLKPVLERMLGRRTNAELKHARLASPLPANGARESYLRAQVSTDDHGQLVIDAAGDQDSSLLTVLAGSDALLQRAANAPPARAGDTTRFVAIFETATLGASRP